jgi:Xaa-Pro aminopeptidase
MKSDLDRLMEARELVALIVTGSSHSNTPRHYLSNGAHITGGYILKKRGAPPVLIVNPMETEEAAKSGLQVLSYYDLGWAELLKQFEGDQAKSSVAFFRRMLDYASVPSGKIGIYGEGALHVFLALVADLNAAFTDYQFVGESGMSLFDEAYATKDPTEVLRIRSVAARTSSVLQLTWDFIASHHEVDGMVVDAEGESLTIGAVKRFVRRALLDHDLEDTDMIFAQGRDGGFPHSRGEDDEAIRVGEPIVFDLFPREIGGGYFHDTTRTWSINSVKPEVQETYEQVMNAVEVAVDTFRVGVPARALQENVQSYFESLGHPTGRSHPGTNIGYVHGLGHGVGLEIHERPSIGHLSKDNLTIGNVITIEPGLYYPERGFGVRIEDTYYVDETGSLVSLTDFHKEILLPLRG